jgi:hypothetical protein
MGDLIQKLPMDELEISREETDSILLLFGKKEIQDASLPTPSSPTIRPTSTSTSLPPTQSTPPTPPTRLSTTTQPPPPEIMKELMAILIYSIVVFFFMIPYIDELFVGFIPLCKNSWIIRNAIKAIVTAIIAWMIVNRRHMSGYGN